MIANRPLRSRRWFDLLAMLVIGVSVVGAALLPAVTANSGEVITIRGDVRVDGRPVPFFPVGFWRPDGEVVRPTTTDANGAFTLDVPATVDGFAYAGAPPDSARAVVEAGEEQLVRGVIGSRAAPRVSTPLYQGFISTTGRGLDGGRAQLRFQLQRAGRIAGTSPVPVRRLRSVQVRRLDGSLVQTLRTDARGRFRSAALAPGDYGVVVTPDPPALPVVAGVAVRSGATTAAALGAPVQGATLDGVIRTSGGPVGAGVPVLVVQDGRDVAGTTTTAAGRYSVPGLPVGDYTVEVGRSRAADAPAPAARVPSIPGSRAAPAPAPSSTPAPEPSTAALAALAPVERTSDDVLPRRFPVAVTATLGTVTTDAVVDAAGHVSGTVTGALGAPVQVVIEDSVTGRILRATTADDAGRYTFGGLVQDTAYTVWAVTRPVDPTTAVMGSAQAFATAATNRVDVALDQPALSVEGTVPDTREGRVAIGDPALLRRTAQLDGSGAYAVHGLVPGAYPAVVSTPGRVDSEPVAVEVLPPERGATEAALTAGPRPAALRAWFISGGAGVPVVVGSATDAGGDVVRFSRTIRGRLSLRGLRPGSYSFDAEAFRGTVPATDGPWFFQPPIGSFTLSDGATTDLSPVVLHARAR